MRQTIAQSIYEQAKNKFGESSAAALVEFSDRLNGVKWTKVNLNN